MATTLPVQWRYKGFCELGVLDDSREKCCAGGERACLHPARVRDGLGGAARGAVRDHGGLRRGRCGLWLSFPRFPPLSSPPPAFPPWPGALSLSPVPACTGSGRRSTSPPLMDHPFASERLLRREVGVVRLVVRAGSEEGEGGRAAALQAVKHAAAPRDGRVEPAPGVGDWLYRLEIPTAVLPFGISPTSLFPPPRPAPGPPASAAPSESVGFASLTEFAPSPGFAGSADSAFLVFPATVLEVVSALSSGASSFGSHRCLPRRR